MQSDFALSGSSTEDSKGTHPTLIYVDTRPRAYLVEPKSTPPRQRPLERPSIAVVRGSIVYSTN